MTNHRPKQLRRIPPIAIRIIYRETLVQRSGAFPLVPVRLVDHLPVVDICEGPIPEAKVDREWEYRQEEGETGSGAHSRGLVHKHAGEEILVLVHLFRRPIRTRVRVVVAFGIDARHGFSRRAC